jgi:hypothetical protein
MSRVRSWARVVSFAFAAFGTAVVALCLDRPAGLSAPLVEKPRATAAFFSGKQIIVVLRVSPAAGQATPVKVALLGPGKRLLQAVTQRVQAGRDPTQVQFAFARPTTATDRVTVRGPGGDVPLAKIFLLKAHETTLFAPAELVAGCPTVLRCAVHSVRSLRENLPLEATVSAALTGPDGKERRLFQVRTKADGVAHVSFRTPELPPGPCKLKVQTRSSLGEETLVGDIPLRSGARVLLTTDKPLYQPGQTIYLRALALRSFDLRPVVGKPLTIEVADGKGNKVFRRTVTTSAFGVAQADFTLADEVNTGDYRISARVDVHSAEKTVAVRPYTLPKFKVALSTDRPFYLPREDVKCTLQVDYFFGKPVAGAEVEVKGSTFDVAFKDFHTFKGKTDAAGALALTVCLPAYFVGQPLKQGNAVVRFEARVTDTANQTETASLSRPVSDRPIQVSLIPDGGRVAPGMENRIHVAAHYPDGQPAPCAVEVWVGAVPQGKPVASLRTNRVGLAGFTLTPAADDFRDGGYRAFTRETLRGVEQQMMPSRLLDLTVRVRDARGNRARSTVALNTSPTDDNVSLWLPDGVYKAGEDLAFEVRSTAGLPTVYLDVVRSGQTVLTRWFDSKSGLAKGKLTLPPGVFGTLEVHAYQFLPSGEMRRDARVVYVHPGQELRVKATADKAVHRPGEEGVVHFEVIDAKGNPAQAALGVLVVDEAVYALQEMQPGLDKAFFTLQQELLTPTAAAVYRPAEGMTTLIGEPQLTKERQQIARVLLAQANPAPPPRWVVTPDPLRRDELSTRIERLGWAVWYDALERPTVLVPGPKGSWRFARGVLERAEKRHAFLPQGLPSDKFTLDRLTALEPGFTADNLAWMLTCYRLEGLVGPLQDRYATRRQWFQADKPALLERMLVEASRLSAGGVYCCKDAWGRNVRLVKRSAKDPKTSELPGVPGFTLVSAGPDGRFGTDDDIFYRPIRFTIADDSWWRHDGRKLVSRPPWDPKKRGVFQRRDWVMDMSMFNRTLGYPGFAFNLGVGGSGLGALGGGLGALGGGLMVGGMGAAGLQVGGFNFMGNTNLGVGGGAIGSKGPQLIQVGNPGIPPRAAGPAPARLRSYFPETMLWHPALITDARGRATLKTPFADSITTWRLTASASSPAGGLGGASIPLRVFQPFFVDLDLPVALTQGDEVAFPVAVYNYLKTPQTVALELKPGPAFDLADGQGPRRSVKLAPNQVASVRFRIRAKKVGRFPLTVDARGQTHSDAVKRSIDVLPDGVLREQTHSGLLAESARHTVTVPPAAIDGASRLLVKVYPGVHSQLLEGVEGMLQFPHGCFEQTSSTVYPSILALEYLQKNRLASPGTLTLAQEVLNAGYQRLLTFERPGGGFDLWGTGPPAVWLSAYGLAEFSDMQRVWPVDPAVINRTREWLLKHQAADGSWADPEAPGPPPAEWKLLLTSYVASAMLSTADRPKGWKESKEHAALEKAVAYIRLQAAAADSAYALALAANALAAWDETDADARRSLEAIFRKLDRRKERMAGGEGFCYPSSGSSLCHSRGEGLTIETTALVALAMVRAKRPALGVTQALAYLVKSRGPGGTWGSTQATVLALKALLAGAAGPHKGTTKFAVKVNGKPAAAGKVTPANSDLLQQFDLTGRLKPGANEVSVDVEGETTLLYQVAGRFYTPAARAVEPVAPPLEVAVAYDRTKLTTNDLLKAKATLRYNGKKPAYQVIVELPVPPAFTPQAAEFARMVEANRVQRFDVRPRTVVLYLEGVRPGAVHEFVYSLKAKYPVKAKAPAATAYEYYTPANRATGKRVPLVVE